MATKKAYHHGNLREALVAAALKEIAKSGPDGFSLREVARRAGVSAPAVYRHFADKDQLLAAVAAECSQRIGAAMEKAVAAAPPDPLEQFRARGIAYVQFAVSHPEHFRAMSLPKFWDRLPKDQLAEADADNADQREQILRGQQEGLIAGFDVETILMFATAAVHGLAQFIVEGKLGDVDEKRATELANKMTAFLAAGLEPRNEPFEDALSGVKLKGRTR
ncbi:MAG TPA: TetR/AcrR family transcriptional regulator [Kofleriaceae bacterium]